MVDYVLTVAVSTASAMSNIGSAIPFVADHKVLLLRVRDRAGDGVEPARNSRIRCGVRHSDLRVHRRRGPHARLGAVPDLRAGRSVAGRIRRLCDACRTRFDHRLCVGVPGGAVVLLGVCGADRCRGDQQRSAGVSEAQVAQCGNDAAVAGHDRRQPVDGHHLAGEGDPGPDRRQSRRPAGRHPRRTISRRLWSPRSRRPSSAASTSVSC